MASNIFAVVEILEKILSELPPLDIIQCQRVTSTWRELITTSPLLQYQTWLRNDILDPAYHIRPEDFIADDKYGHYSVDAHAQFDVRYKNNISRHVHPIVVARELESASPDASFDPLRHMEKDGFGGHFTFRPIVIHDLMVWYEKHKATEHIWGSMSLCRPDARVIHWEASDSTGNIVPRMKLQAVRTDESGTGDFAAKQEGDGTVIYKRYPQPLVLTLSDLMRWLNYAWHLWIEQEHGEHDRWHEGGGGCMGNKGIPRDDCLRSDDEGDGTDPDYVPCAKYGPRMTMEEHIEEAMEAASI